jgi:hypothetical protein
MSIPHLSLFIIFTSDFYKILLVEMLKLSCVPTVVQLTITMMRPCLHCAMPIVQRISKINQRSMKTLRSSPLLSLSHLTSPFCWLQDAMLREFQEEIKRLKDQLEAAQRGVMIDEVTGKVCLFLLLSLF